MTELDLEAGKNLLGLIKVTEKALVSLNKWMDERLTEGGEEPFVPLNLCEFSDGSGNRVCISRKVGNTRLLLLIKEELEEQLASFKEDFANL